MIRRSESRRDFVTLSGATAAGAVLAACGTAPAPGAAAAALHLPIAFLNSLLAVILTYMSWSSLAIIFIRAYFMSIPPELEDAARVYGAGELQILRHVDLQTDAGRVPPRRRPAAISDSLVSVARHHDHAARSFYLSRSSAPLRERCCNFRP